MTQDIAVESVLFNQREVFEIWKNRFVDEYNRSKQARQGHILLKGVPANHWKQSFEHDVGPHWIRQGTRNIGFVSPQQITIGTTPETAQPVKVISDVYVDPKFRGKGLLWACLKFFQEQHHKAILIDALKLADNAGYYVELGYKYASCWHDQDLLIVSTEPLVDSDMWIEFFPDTMEQLVKEAAE